jgi:DNA invertase Pin-like site-specific DNA recombinase
MLEHIAGNGVRRIIVETASRFARDLMVQEIGFKMLQSMGVELIAADSPDSFADDTPTSKLIRQILGGVAEFEKAMLVAKLRGARDRASARAGQRVEGRKGYKVHNPTLVKTCYEIASELGDSFTLKSVADRLSEQGFANSHGKIFAPAQIARMLS